MLIRNPIWMHIYLYIYSSYQCSTCLVCPKAYGCDIAQQSFAQDVDTKHQSLPIPPWLELFLAPFQSRGEHVFLFRKSVVLPCQHKMDVL